MDVPKIILIPASEENTPENRKLLEREAKPIFDLGARPNLPSTLSTAKSVLGALPGVGWLVRGGSGSSTLPEEVFAGAGAVWIQVLATVGPALGTALGAWLQSKSGRKIRIKYGPDGNFEVEANNVEELKTAMEVIKNNQSSKVILGP